VIRLEDANSPRLSGAWSRARVVDRDPAARDGETRHAHDSRGYGWLRWLLIAIDFAGALATWGITLLAGGPDAWTDRFGRSASLAMVLALVTVALNGVQRLYLARVCALRSLEIGRLARTCLVCGLGAAWLGAAIRDRPSPSEAVIGAIATFALLATLRNVYAAWLRGCRARHRFVRKVCVLGTNEEAAALVELLETQPELGYRVVGVIGEREEWQPTHPDVPVVAIGSDVVDSVLATGASGVLVAVSAVAAGDLDRVVRDLMAGGIHVQISSGLARVGHQRLRFAPLSHQLMFYVEPHKLNRWQAAVKRMLDVIVGSIVLVCAAPVLVAAAVAIKLDDRGPVLYWQERVGRDGRRFDVLKLRTMVPDASAQLKLLEAQNERSGPLFKLSSDPRVTSIGRFLRATSIDELPQLVNVVRGDMSLVGPRPALPSEVEQFDHELQERISVPPGLTGLWQVEARDNPSFRAYRRLDLFYVDNWSLTMDLAIIASTVLVVVGRAVRALRGCAELAQPVVRQPEAVAPAMALVDASGAPKSSLPA
jgi:exopolysaccharide biosynthesis polyprenyl glycosylphosphotransferase